jgi:hypothetical protein
MIYVKSILAGLAALVVSVILCVAVFALSVYASSRGAGSGGIGAVTFTIGPIVFILAVLIFAAGFWWEFHRLTHP